jgi:hypothetical protein
MALIAYYPFIDNAEDESGNGYDAYSETGVTYSQNTPGNRPGTCAVLSNVDGASVSSYIYLMTAAQATEILGDEQSGQISVSIWFRSDAANRSDSVLARIITRDLSDYWAIGITQYSASGSQLLRVNEAGAGRTISSTIETGVWHHIVAVFDYDSTYLTVYLDNEEAYSGAVLGGSLATSRCICIGCGAEITPSLVINSGSFIGAVDELYLYDHALTAEEVDLLYQLSPRGASDAVLLELSKSSNRPFHLVEVEFSDGTYYMTDAHRSIIYGGETYLAYGHALNFTDITETTNLQINSLTLQISAIDQQYISAFLSKNYLNRAVKIYKAFFDGNMVMVNSPLLFFRGRMNAPVLQEDPDNGTSIFEIQADSHLSDYDRCSGRRTNSESQQLFYPGDNIFRFAAKNLADIKWGSV